MVPEPPRMVPESPESLCQTVPESPRGATKEMINRCLTHLHAISLACHITQRAAHLGFVLSNMVPESPRGGGCRRRSDGTFAPELGSKQSGGAKKAYKGLCEQVTETPINASETAPKRLCNARPSRRLGALLHRPECGGGCELTHATVHTAVRRAAGERVRGRRQGDLSRHALPRRETLRNAQKLSRNARGRPPRRPVSPLARRRR